MSRAESVTQWVTWGGTDRKHFVCRSLTGTKQVMGNSKLAPLAFLIAKLKSQDFRCVFADIIHNENTRTLRQNYLINASFRVLDLFISLCILILIRMLCSFSNIDHLEIVTFCFDRGRISRAVSPALLLSEYSPGVMFIKSLCWSILNQL